MTAFTIFVLLLTFGYLVYFAVMITLELHKKEEVQKSDEEVFDVSDMAEQEEPTCIEEHINNEDNGVLTYTDELTDDGIRILNPTSGIQQSPITRIVFVIEPSTPDTNSEIVSGSFFLKNTYT